MQVPRFGVNADLAALSSDGEFRYLALLTAEGIKPLSRWEMHLDNEQLRALQRLGLHVSRLIRSTQWGRLIPHTIFSRRQSILHTHKLVFDGAAISYDSRSVHQEGLDFGYPRCCVEAYIENGYKSNGLTHEEQAILFHWACPDCEQTRQLLPEYWRIYHSVRSVGV